MIELNAQASHLIATWMVDRNVFRAYAVDLDTAEPYLITTTNQTPDGQPGDGFEAVAEWLVASPEFDDDGSRWGGLILAPGYARLDEPGSRFVLIHGRAYAFDYAEGVVLASVEFPLDAHDEDITPANDDRHIDPIANRDALNAVREALNTTLGAVLDIDDLDDTAPRLLAALRAELGGFLIDPAIVGLGYVNASDGAERTREVYLNLDDPMADNYRWQDYDGAQWGPLQ